MHTDPHRKPAGAGATSFRPPTALYYRASCEQEGAGYAHGKTRSEKMTRCLLGPQILKYAASTRLDAERRKRMRGLKQAAPRCAVEWLCMHRSAA